PPPACRFAPRCRYVQDRCREIEPALEGDSWEHAYRCFFPVGKAHEAEDEAALTVIDVAHARRAPAEPSKNGDGVLLKTEHLVKSFSVTAGAVLQRKIGEVSAVADVSFSIRPGQTFGMVGESGCGKTTIGRLIAGLEKANGGSIILDGEDLVHLSKPKAPLPWPTIPLLSPDSYASVDPPIRVRPRPRE